jgi:YHS domain-containing protein
MPGTPGISRAIRRPSVCQELTMLRYHIRPGPGSASRRVSFLVERAVLYLVRRPGRRARAPNSIAAASKPFGLLSEGPDRAGQDGDEVVYWKRGGVMDEGDDLLVFDPICGMWLSPGEIAARFTYLGQTYCFCCEECRKLFSHSPELYVAILAHEPGSSAGYRCPCRRRAASRAWRWRR